MSREELIHSIKQNEGDSTFSIRVGKSKLVTELSKPERKNMRINR